MQRRFEQQALPLRKRIYGLALQMVGNPSDAEDITQETLLRAWTHYPTYDRTRSFNAWVYQIALNLCRDQHRWRKHRHLVSLEALQEEGGGGEPAANSGDPVECLLTEEISEELWLGLRGLPASQRRCLLLEPDHSYEEIAALLNCPVGTVRSRLHRARAHLHRVLTSRQSRTPV